MIGPEPLTTECFSVMVTPKFGRGVEWAGEPLFVEMTTTNNHS
jgi:hypothetical protein